MSSQQTLTYYTICHKYTSDWLDWLSIETICSNYSYKEAHPKCACFACHKKACLCLSLYLCNYLWHWLPIINYLLTTAYHHWKQRVLSWSCTLIIQFRHVSPRRVFLFMFHRLKCVRECTHAASIFKTFPSWPKDRNDIQFVPKYPKIAKVN